MKRIRGIFSVLAALLFSGAVCSAQDGGGKQILLSAFNKIVTRGNIQLIIVPNQDAYSMSVDCHGDIKDNGYRYRVKKDVLYITVPTGVLSADGFVRAMVSVPTISELELDGTELETISPIKGESLSILASGVVNSARLLVDVESLDVNIGGNSDIAVGGYARSANLSAQLGSRVNALTLSADSVWVRANEGSEAYLNAKKYMYAKVATSGTVYYIPNDAKVYTKVRSGGNVTPIKRAMADFGFAKNDEIEIKQEDIDRLTDTDNDIPLVKEQSVKESGEKDEDFF